MKTTTTTTLEWEWERTSVDENGELCTTECYTEISVTITFWDATRWEPSDTEAESAVESGDELTDEEYDAVEEHVNSSAFEIDWD